MKELITKDTLFIQNKDGEMILDPNALELIRSIEVEKKKLEKQYKKYKAALLDGMEAYGLEKVDTEDLLITYVAPTERCSIDTEKLWDEYKDVAFKCQKVSPVNSSVRITVR